MSQIKLIVGLGNPGTEYAQTRHNAGFWLLDELAAAEGASFREEKKFAGEVAKVSLAGKTCWLLKPTTFMNRSGQAVGALARFYQIQADEILVVHDELDLDVGRIKLKLGGGNGGHNGLKDIQAHLATPNFYRLRLGIGHPGEKAQVIHYVLNKPSQSEREAIDASIEKSLRHLPKVMAGEVEVAMRALHAKD